MRPLTESSWDHWILASLTTVVWLVSWWQGGRRFRLWFALLAPAGAVAGLILGVLATLTEPSEPGAGADGSTGFGEWLFAGSLVALCVAVPLTVLTLIVEYVLLVRRTP